MKRKKTVKEGMSLKDFRKEIRKNMFTYVPFIDWRLK